MSFGARSAQTEGISDLMAWRRDSRARPFNGRSVVAAGGGDADLGGAVRALWSEG